MPINFKQWLLDLGGQTGTTARSHDEQIGYVLHVKDQVLTPAQVTAKVNAYRDAGTTFEDTVPGSQAGSREKGSGRSGMPGRPGTL
jgi:hypothetical protein